MEKELQGMGPRGTKVRRGMDGKAWGLRRRVCYRIRKGALKPV